MKKITLIITILISLVACNDKKNDSSALLGLLVSANSAGGSSTSSTGSNTLTLNLSGAKAVGVSKANITSTRKASNTTNAVVIASDNTVSPAFSTGNVKVKRFYVTPVSKQVLAYVSEAVKLKTVDGVSTIYDPTATRTVSDNISDYKDCYLLLADTKGNIRCLDYDVRTLASTEDVSVQIDSEDNIFVVGKASDFTTVLINKYKADGSSPKQTLLTGLYNIQQFLVTGTNEVIVSFMQSSNFRFESIKNGVRKLISTNSYGGNFQFVKKFPDGKFYYAHNIGGASGTGLFNYDSLTDVETNISNTASNWIDNVLSSDTFNNFCSAGNGYPTINNSKVFMSALAQVPQGHVDHTKKKLYQLYPLIRQVAVSTFDQVHEVYSIEDSNEILVAGSVSGSNTVQLRLVNTNDYSSRSTVVPGDIEVPQGITINQEKKTIEFIKGTTVHTFDFTSGSGVYSSKILSTELTSVNSL